MKTKAAILRTQPGKWDVVEVELDEPKRGEVLVRMSCSGLCHSDDHIAKNDVKVPLPYNGGHEGSGIVEAIGEGVRELAVGDHIVTSFVPACGKCRWCASGMQNLCDAMAKYSRGAMTDGTYRMHLDGVDVAKNGGLGTFSEWNVFHQESCIKIRDEVPLDVACLAGCGVPTGWGSAVNGAKVQAGDVVIVMGIGGLGANALQGARACGASRVIAVDTMRSKRDVSFTFGATDFTTSIDDGAELARSLTNGQGADSAIITISVINGESIAQAFSAIRKAGTVVVTSQGNAESSGIPVNHFELAMYQKRIQGVLYGNGSPNREVHRLLDMYMEGRLKLDELITTRYDLEQINDGYQDLLDGKNVRGIIQYS
jgi:NDMA-dependent alcohol dehydrogenase